MADSRTHLWQLLLCSGIVSLGNIILLAFTNPNDTGFGLKLTALVAIGCTSGLWASTVGFVVRLLLRKNPEQRPLATSIRQGVFIAGLVIALLVLQVIGLFTWWIVLTVVLLLLVLELFLNL